MPQQVSQFVHRQNQNGTFDSICTLCFQTIANVKDEAKLQSVELEHVCDPHLIRRFEPKSTSV